MSNKFKLTRTAFLIGTTILSHQAFSAGFQIVEHSASGLGRAFAGEAAIADNASALARNPASLSLLDSANVTAGISYIDPTVFVEFSKGTFIDAREDNAAPSALVPNFYYSRPINEQLTWGLGSYADFGLASDYGSEANADFGAIAGDTAVQVINLNNSLAYQINEQLTLGASASILLAHAELNRFDSKASMAPNYDGNLVSSMKGGGIGFGYKIGALYEVNQDHRFGIAYTGASDVDMEGKFSGLQLSSPEGNGPFHYFNDIDGELTLNLPSIMELSGFHQLTDDFAVHYSWMHIGWSSFQEILATSVGNECSSGQSGDKECLRKEEGWKDSNRYAFGATYNLSPAWTIRGGIAKDETPTVEHVTASIPDSSRHWYSLGASYAHAQHNFDAGVTYIVGDDSTIHEEEGSYFKVTESTAWIYAIQYTYRFK